MKTRSPDAVDQTDDAASVVLEEDGFWENVSFVDFFSFARIDGMWKIVNKTFVHTGAHRRLRRNNAAHSSPG